MPGDGSPAGEGGSAGGGGGGGMLDLEKELTCSICTDVLYHPLTLLDCLHTFCGACLKEWFHFQCQAAERARITPANPFTCPSCRASVRGTRPNATVTTLLDMFLAANPGRGKSAQEMEDSQRQYKPGDEVIPKVRTRAAVSRRRREAEAEEERVLDRVREMSLREAGVTDGSSSSGEDRNRLRVESGRPRARSASERVRSETRRERSTHRERSRHSPSRSHAHSASAAPSTSRRSSPRRRSPSAEPLPTRQVEHQSSLRSLLSNAEIDSHEIEEEIMRQIVEEGLLDGIDLDNIDVAQEEEISERIAEAYRRRQRERQRERDSARERERARDREREREQGVRSRSHRRSESASIPTRSRPSSSRGEEQPRRRPHGRSESSVSMSAVVSQPQTQSHTSRPPVSRPHLFDAANAPQDRRRSSSQGRSHSLGGDTPPGSTVSPRSAARSAAELTGQSVTSEQRRRRMSQQDRSRTDPEGRTERRAVSGENPANLAPRANSYSASNPNSPRRTAFGIDPSDSSVSVASPAAPRSRQQPPNASSTSLVLPVSELDLPPTSRPPLPTASARPASRPGSSSGPSPAPVPAPLRLPTYSEPQISCNRCGKSGIQYDVHYNCPKCENGTYNLCLRCYRQGAGCLHWFGFGYAAWARYERQAPAGGYPSGHQPPHVLTGHRYARPRREPVLDAGSGELKTTENPAKRLQAGVFCDSCQAFANACYWKCDFCNEGEWGYCNDCTNRGFHCTHPLLPLAHKDPIKPSSASNGVHHSRSSTAPNISPTAVPTSPSSPPSSTISSIIPKKASLLRGPAPHLTLANLIFRGLTFTTACDICRYPIPPSITRFHCPTCNHGDYDICTSCYHGLVLSGRIPKENGPQGWRRCERGHRMRVIGFEDRLMGQRRIVVSEIVGGWALKEGGSGDGGHAAAAPGATNWSWRELDGRVRSARDRQPANGTSSSLSSPSSSTTTNALLASPSLGQTSGWGARPFPPDGGVGLRVLALWSYWPLPDVADELAFPKGAEITEAEDINGDWFWGVYAGRTGLFPGNYGRVLSVPGPAPATAPGPAVVASSLSASLLT